MVKKIPFFLLSMVGIVFFTFTQSAHALGVGPSTLLVENIPAGSTVTRSISVLRGNPSKEERALLELSGPATPYLILPNGKDVILEKGAEKTEIPVTINAAKLGAGAYEAELAIRVLPPEESSNKEAAEGLTSRAVVAQGVSAHIRFTVTTEAVEDYTINAVMLENTEEKHVVGLSYDLINNGSVGIHPGRVTVTILDKGQNKEIFSETIEGDRLPVVPALSREWAGVLTTASLPIGLYLATVRIYNNKGEELIKRDVHFQVFPEGTLAQKGELGKLTADKEKYTPGEKIKFVGSFNNTGSVGVSAVLQVEIFNNDERVETLETEQTYVPKKVASNLSLYYTPQKTGSYSARGTVSYGPFKTNESVVYFKVEIVPLWIIIAGGIGSVIIVLGAILFFIKRKGRKNGSALSSAT